jgi:gas vesicle protein
MEETQNEGSNRLAWFLTGAVVGVTIAILYTPSSGRDTRQLITDKSRDALGDTGKSLIEAGREMFDRGRQLVEDAAELFERGRKLAQG